MTVLATILSTAAVLVIGACGIAFFGAIVVEEIREL